jgi:hypothetical protein
MSAGMITCSDLGTFSSVTFCNMPWWQLLLLQICAIELKLNYYYYVFCIIYYNAL